MIWLAAAALADEPTWPELEAAIAATDATVQRGPSVWTLVISGRPMVVPAPRTAADAAAIAVLVRSLGLLPLMPVEATAIMSPAVSA